MKPEILAPGGSFSSAYYAFDAGADAVYLGLQDYSARKKAVNFSLDEIRRLKGAWPDKKLYLALNTLLKDQDLEALLPQLPALLDLPLEAIILQDYGLASFLKNIISQGGASGPALHASTQMAVHSVQGAKFLQSQGFSRVVLARELRLPEIKEIRKALPDLELEVFVLGANCYGFSGLCLASGLFLGRSANRGECGQVCRTWFSAEGSRAPVPQGYWFSLGDRMDEAWIRDLSDLGIQSLKIEGRMKSPAYVQGAVRFCRQALGHLEEVQEGQKTGGSEPPEQALRRIFFRGSEGDRRVNPRYPGATGEPFLRVGIQDGDAYRYSEIQNTGEKSFPIKDSKTPLPPLQQRDGLLVLREEGGLLKGRPFSAKLDPRGYLIAPFPLIEGETVYRSRTEADRLPEIKAERFPLWKKPLGGQLSYLGGELRLNLPGFVFSASLKAEVPRNVGGMLQTLRKILRQSGEYPWVLDDLVVQDLELQGQRVPELYFSPKDLKAFRRDFYRALEDYQEERGRKSLAAYEAQDPLPQQLLGDS
jgi:putative protease